MQIEVIMAAYNNPRILSLVLDGYLRQRDSDFSLCIADDGSDGSIRKLVDDYCEKGLSLRYLWQEDDGFRKGKIVNQAIATSRADYLILTDNDCIPSAYFVGDHRRWARPGHFVAGRRVDTKLPLAKRLLARETPISRLDNFGFLVWQAMVGGLKRAEIALRPPALIAEIWGRRPMALLGANIGVWREDILAVNGFDTQFQGYGAEEVDLEWRLKAYGSLSRPARGRACLYHIYHPKREVADAAHAMLERKRQQGRYVTPFGIRAVGDADTPAPGQSA